ncbi:MAG: hypothetical protein ACOC0S_00700 [Desulfohalobiaceae bacterium]
MTGLEIPVRAVDGLAIGMFVAVYLLQKYRIKKDPTLTLPLEERRRLKKESQAQASG